MSFTWFNNRFETPTKIQNQRCVFENVSVVNHIQFFKEVNWKVIRCLQEGGQRINTGKNDC